MSDGPRAIRRMSMAWELATGTAVVAVGVPLVIAVPAFMMALMAGIVTGTTLSTAQIVTGWAVGSACLVIASTAVLAARLRARADTPHPDEWRGFTLRRLAIGPRVDRPTPVVVEGREVMAMDLAYAVGRSIGPIVIEAERLTTFAHPAYLTVLDRSGAPLRAWPKDDTWAAPTARDPHRGQDVQLPLALDPTHAARGDDPLAAAVVLGHPEVVAWLADHPHMTVEVVGDRMLAYAVPAPGLDRPTVHDPATAEAVADLAVRMGHASS